ncbi:MAG: cell division FtsZ family protein [Deltaproteobacteria bacterium]|jgi:cell division protein FtsZ|nr:cell division FtsZ family protein [Deltaproteobacteria bacterium]
MNEVIEPMVGPSSDLFKIKVFGIGGCGNNAVNHMVGRGLEGPVLIAANTDVADLRRSVAPVKLQIGPELTNGFGSGGRVEIGRQAAQESLGPILDLLDGADIVFLTCGLGGGTGTGGAPVVAEALGRLKRPPLVVTVAVLPFVFEKDRQKKALPALKSLLQFSNSVIAISNGKFAEIMPDATFKECKAMADDVLYHAVRCITELILRPGEIHNDFSDIRSTLSVKGRTIMGMGQAKGPNRGLKALEEAVACPLMVDQSIDGARVLLINIVSDEDVKMKEIAEINNRLVELASPDVVVFSGHGVDNSLADSGIIKVTVMATGLEFEDLETREALEEAEAARALLGGQEPPPAPPVRQPQSPRQPLAQQPQRQAPQGQPPLAGREIPGQVSQGAVVHIEGDDSLLVLEDVGQEVDLDYEEEAVAAGEEERLVASSSGYGQVVQPSRDFVPPPKRVVRVEPTVVDRLPRIN